MVKTKRYSELGWFDYFLTGTASCLAGYSSGKGLGVAEIAWFFVGLTAIATLCGASIQRLIPRKLAQADGLFYAVCAVVSVYFSAELNSLLPGDGFPLQLRVAGWLCWMLVFGSFFMWRDSTILFQAVPGIAIFGLVGTWDTFRAAPFLFFIFLLCFATLFARAHGRAMMRRAQASGFTSYALDARSPGGFIRALRRGPWRWMAGPEWALLSALVVVLISLIGAPFLQFSLQGVSGRIKLPPPPTSAMRQNYFGGAFNAPSTNFQTGSVDEVGTGPHGDLEKVRLFSVQFFGDPYMLARTSRVYQGRSWSFVPDAAAESARARADFNLNTRAAKPFGLFRFTVHYIEGTYNSIPIPGALERFLNPNSRIDVRSDGSVENTLNVFGDSDANGISGVVRVPLAKPTTVPSEDPALADYIDTEDHISTARVRDVARQLVQGQKSDYDKVEAIREYIAGHCTYDLNAPPIPEGADAVDYFLFKSKRGYCDLFASAMTVMCQAADLPARYCVGWAPFTHPQHDLNDEVTYYETDYHCWSEVFFKNVGWVIFDATDGADEAPNGGRGATRTATPWYLQWSVGFGVLAFAAIGLVALGMSLARKWKLRLPVIGQRRAELERSYADLVRVLERRTGKPRRPNQTATEYLAVVRPYLDGAYEPVKQMTEKFVSVYYGSAEPLPEDILEVKDLSTAARQALKGVKPPKDEPHPQNG